jgi:hypothetical protein
MNDIGAVEHFSMQNAFTCPRLRITVSSAGGQTCVITM